MIEIIGYCSVSFRKEIKLGKFNRMYKHVTQQPKFEVKRKN